MHPLTRLPKNSEFKMMKKLAREIMGTASKHTCGCRCLGPLTFHTEAVGDKVTLTHGARCATRALQTFRNGLVFSNRRVRIGERVRLRVDRCAQHWHGALRLGFTTVQPTCSPLPDLAIPTLTDTPGYWAAPVPEVYSLPGTELQFWVTSRGVVMFKGPEGQEYILLEGVDVSKHLWALIDVYGQTCTVVLLGSKKKGLFGVRKSCPCPALPPVSPENSCLCISKGRPRPSQGERGPSSTRSLEDVQDPCHSNTDPHRTEEPLEDCVVCMSQEACVLLSCGHRCLCGFCAGRVRGQFGKCPLCRLPIT
ncbi:E3 ubiquitin-protein ligase NEURL3 [Megalops cyprinoides]|uniref:E3 ubiquitin-protein ligase NEURL3 n=1 Tax=Megalops cyprinoides TaxID=118141 RepID=UPI0018644D88|nr:E3 ubiquitin-protein ligase NEURL3 [Megalops cyprinoides]